MALKKPKKWKIQNPGLMCPRYPWDEVVYQFLGFSDQPLAQIIGRQRIFGPSFWRFSYTNGRKRAKIFTCLQNYLRFSKLEWVQRVDSFFVRLGGYACWAIWLGGSWAFGRQCPEGWERAACIGMSSSAIAQAQKWCLWHDIRVRFRHVVCDYIACGRCLPFMRCMRPRWFSWGVRAQADSDT